MGNFRGTLASRLCLFFVLVFCASDLVFGHKSQCTQGISKLFGIWQIADLHEFQKGRKYCSLASATIVINQILKDLDISPNTKTRFTQGELLRFAGQGWWKRAIQNNKDGIVLADLANLLTFIFDKLGVQHLKVELVRAQSIATTTESFLSAVNQIEAGKGGYIIANFLQSALRGETDLSSGHFSPLGGYSKLKREVYLLETDDMSSGPTWIDLDGLVKAMHTFDPDSGENRGFIFIRKI